MNSREKLFRRVEHDIAAGKTWTAIHRLQDRMRSKGLEAQTLARLARLHQQAGDSGSAGRFYLLSGAEGDDVEAAVASYLSSCGGDIQKALRQIPLALDIPVAKLPDAAKRRLRVLGVEVDHGTISVGEVPRGASPGSQAWGITAAIGCGALLVLFVIGGILNILSGAQAVAGWIARLFGR